MKKGLYTALVFGILLVPIAISAKEGPPNTQTLEQKTPATGKTEQKSSQTIIKRVEIAKDGTTSVYYYAEGDTTAPQLIPDGKNRSEEKTKESDNPTDTETSKLKVLIEEFSKIWSRGIKRSLSEYATILPDSLTKEELTIADERVKSYFDILSAEPHLFPFDIFNILERGNRYANLVDRFFSELDTPENEEWIKNRMAESYAHFIGFGTEKSRTEDMPNDQDKLSALQKLEKIVRSNDTPYFFLPNEMAEIRRLNPPLYTTLLERQHRWKRENPNH